MLKCVNVRLRGPERSDFAEFSLQLDVGTLEVAARKLLVPGHWADVSNGQAESEGRTRCQHDAPDPDGIPLAECPGHPSTFGGSMDKPLVVSKGGCAEDRDGSSHEKLWADQEIGPFEQCGT